MLSRFMRHPAGLMKKALGGRFLVSAFRSESAPAGTPDYPAYWSHRYSGPGLLLIAPAPSAQPPATLALVHALHPDAASLPAQGGKASSFLTFLGAAKVPAARA